ncbi:hypothetical protein HPB47_027080 [Ixodes persulcatus]|uniref:Uncharacterized protein n=1 Tax=Ixodes persulcatus TaxID=34615 RepID=A0AC60PZB8_IXOPE|nr:hypothetical protein HPB47_027080 [Ixodes persulcatus]
MPSLPVRTAQALHMSKKDDIKNAARNPPQSQVQLIWTPAHSGLEGNEAAHDLARGLTIRAGPSLYPYHGARSARDRLVGYHDITAYYLLSRRIYPQADKSLRLEQSHVWRQLHTGVFPNPATMTHIHPSLYPTSVCPLCGAHANLAHIIWACPQDPFPEIPSEERWEASLRSPDPDLQARLVKRAKEVAGKPRPTATTGPPT